jgi:hypothetical protein
MRDKRVERRVEKVIFWRANEDVTRRGASDSLFTRYD